MKRRRSRNRFPSSKRTAHVCNRRVDRTAETQTGARRSKRALPRHAPSGMRATGAHAGLGRWRFAPGEIVLALARSGGAAGGFFPGAEAVRLARLVAEGLGRVALAAESMVRSADGFRAEQEVARQGRPAIKTDRGGSPSAARSPAEAGLEKPGLAGIEIPLRTGPA